MQDPLIPEGAIFIGGASPAADAGGRSAAYISMKGYAKIYAVAYINQANAATILLSILQATAVAGTGAKALATNVPIWANQDAAAQTVFTKATDAVTFTTSAALKDKIVVFAIPGSALDASNSFDCLKMTTGASNAANITSVFYFGVPAYASASPVNALVD